MIAVRRLNNSEFIINADYIESLESTPDTVITLTNGKKIIVRDRIEEVVKRVIKYKQLCHQSLKVVTRTEEQPARS